MAIINPETEISRARKSGNFDGVSGFWDELDIFDKEYFETAQQTTSGQIKVWNGSVWESKPLKVWNGSIWTIKPLKVWDGSSWNTTNY